MEVPRLGRKWAMCFAAVLMGLSLFLYATVNSVAGFTGMNLFEYWAQSRTFHLLPRLPVPPSHVFYHRPIFLPLAAQDQSLISIFA